MPDLFDVDDLWPHGYDRVLELATKGDVGRVLEGQGVALLFEKPSARTRNSTEMAVVGLGGHPIYIQGAEVGLDTRESAEDIARTLGCYHRIVCARVFDHDTLVRMAFALEGSGFDVPGHQFALRRGSSLPGHRRRDHVTRGARPAAGSGAGLHR